jgi:hypothetical protein
LDTPPLFLSALPDPDNFKAGLEIAALRLHPLVDAFSLAPWACNIQHARMSEIKLCSYLVFSFLFLLPRLLVRGSLSSRAYDPGSEGFIAA